MPGRSRPIADNANHCFMGRILVRARRRRQLAAGMGPHRDPRRPCPPPFPRQTKGGNGRARERAGATVTLRHYPPSRFDASHDLLRPPASGVLAYRVGGTRIMFGMGAPELIV